MQALTAFCLLILTPFALAVPAHHDKQRVTNFVVMGDSYSDSCNVYNFSAKNKTTFPVCPPPPTGRADQGRSWPEWIRIDQNQKVTSKSAPGGYPTKPGQWDVLNLAQSGATCDNDIFPRSPIPDIGQQTTLYQNDYNTTTKNLYLQSDPDTTTLAMFIGTNDVTFMDNGTGSVQQETACIRKRLNKLHDVGFQRFLMIENINLQDCPLLNTTRYRDNTTRFVHQNNKQQASLFQQLTSEWNDGSRIDVFPAYRLFSAFYNHPSSYGFTNVDGSCNDCKNPGEYLWANSLHPSSRAFHIFARKVVRYLSEGARGKDLIRGAEGL